jgi:coiled-coil domain-containing protein 12
VEPEAAQDDAEVLLNVAPKKANWDLKRDVAKRLDKLERRTLRALYEMGQEEERKRGEEEGAALDPQD